MGIKVISKNKRAGYDFFLDEKFEAGLSLKGTEVKSLRAGKCTMTEAFCAFDRKGELWVQQLRIQPYDFGTYDNHSETRKRKLLLHAKELKDIEHKMATKGLTLVPTIIYFKGSKVKLEIALAKGKKLHDKREATKEREVKRKIQQGNFE